MTSSSEEVPEIPLRRLDVLATTPTASWRVLKPEIDYDKCTNCGLCVDYCPEGVISKSKKVSKSKKGPIIDYEFCKGCGVCANECLKKAIRMKPERW